MVEKKIDFCTKCRKETKYSFTKKGIVKNIEGRDYCFFVTAAICKECGAMMSPPGLIDQNVREVEEQYQKMQERI
ncbi:hypothetical protein ACKX2L_06325 [Lachnospiraceae bacterium YH-ros2228]